MFESQYLEVVKRNQEQDSAQIGALALLNDENKKQIVDALKYTSYLGDPQDENFMRDYILDNPGEFTCESAKLGQALNELNMRTTNMLGESYLYSKTQLELAKLQIERRYKTGELSKQEFDDLIKENEIQFLDIEIQNKQVNIRKQELQFALRVEEALAWKANVEKCLKNMGKDSIDQVDRHQIRHENMQGKIRHWGVRHAEGLFEFTPSNTPIIEKYRKVFDEGFEYGMNRLIEVNPALFVRRCKELGIPLAETNKPAQK